MEKLSSNEEGDEGGEVIDLWWCLIDRVLCDRPINLKSMKGRVASMWRPVKGVLIKEAKNELFMF